MHLFRSQLTIYDSKFVRSLEQFVNQLTQPETLQREVADMILDLIAFNTLHILGPHLHNVCITGSGSLCLFRKHVIAAMGHVYDIYNETHLDCMYWDSYAPLVLLHRTNIHSLLHTVAIIRVPYSTQKIVNTISTLSVRHLLMTANGFFGSFRKNSCMKIGLQSM
jgi:hypothetical protein